jgi:SAM-dependent methyltransferase
MSDALATIFAPLDRLAPGSAATVDRALALAGTAPDARVLDAGCGTGADIPALLAHLPRGQVVAMDQLAGLITALEARHRDPRLTALQGDMTDPPGLFDLIWAGGSAYGPGVEVALRAWRPHLRPGGCVALSDLAWRVAQPSAAARAYWAEEYPALADADALRDRIARAGYRLRGDFWQDPQDWAAYYLPLEPRLDALAGDASLADAILAMRREIALWRAHGAEYGYLMVVAEPV